ncbi:MAG: hypothetical protein QNK05_01395 [Myxococcota bacterium]|nr:hypothetical protein [Myxococcota bacterium]
MCKFPASVALIGLLSLSLCLSGTAALAETPCQGDGVVAQVVSLGGTAWAQAPGEDRRALTCDDVVRACETVITAPGGRVGLLNEDLYTLLGSDTYARVGEDGEGSHLYLDAGALRLLDARSSDDAKLLVSTRDATLHATRVDADVSLWSRVAGPFTRICTHFGDVGVFPHEGTAVVAGSASCAETDRASAQVLAGADPEIEVGSPLDCGLPAVADRFDPTDVAAPPLSGFPGVDVASNIARRPCDATGVCPQSVPPTVPPPVPPPMLPPPPAPAPPIVIVPPPVAPCGAPGFPCP